MVRQRDTLRQLLQSSGNNLDAARQAYATSVGAASPAGAAGMASPAGGAVGTPGGATPGTAGQQQGGPDYRAMLADAEAQLKEYKEEASKTQELLSKDVSGTVCSTQAQAARWRPPQRG